MTNETPIKTAEQTYDPDITEMIVDILKEISPEYADCSFNLIDCIERMLGKMLHAMFSGITVEENVDAVKYMLAEILAESIEKIHDAMARDCDNAIEKL